MTLKAKLTEDMKAAMKAKDSATLSTIRLVNAAIKQFEVDERTEADDAKVQAIISKMIKQRKDSAKIYADADRADLADKENAEIMVLQGYLPEMLSAEAIAAEVAKAVAETGASSMADMGKVMGVLMPRVKGRADGKLINEIVRDHLK